MLLLSTFLIKQNYIKNNLNYVIIFYEKEILSIIKPLSYNNQEILNPENDEYQYRDYQKEAIIKGLT